MSSKYDVVILGSGISSLTAATILSQHGKSVVVLEQYSKLGGYMHCFERRGHRFDTGAHYVGALGPSQSFWALLNYLGVYDSELFVPLDPDAFDVLHFPEQTISIPKGYCEVVKRLQDHFPTEREAVVKFFAFVQEAVKHFPTYTYSDTPETSLSLKYLTMSLTSVVESLTKHQGLQAVLYAYCCLHGVQPQDVSFGLHALTVDSLIIGPYGFAKGGEALTDKFVQKITEHGGEVLTKKRVVELKVLNQNVNEVVTEDGETYVGEWVISGLHPKATFGLLSSTDTATTGIRKVFNDRLNNMAESIGIFGLYAVCENPPKEMNRLSNYYFFDKTEPHEFLKARTPKDIPGVVFSSPAERSAAKSSSKFPINLHAAGPIEWFNDWRGSRWARRSREYHECKKEFAGQMLALAERYQPGLEASIVYSETSTPLSNLHFNGSHEGSAFGIYHSIDNTGLRALSPRTKILNLLLTGQSTLFPGLIASASSGLRTSAHLIGMKPLIREIKRHFQPEAHT